MKNKKGISLIVLVITIIVMIILASAVVLTLSNTGIINKANDAVTKTDKGQVTHLATMIWSEEYMNGKRGDALKKDVLDRLKDYTDEYNIDVTEKGVTVKDKNETTEPEGWRIEREYDADGKITKAMVTDGTVSYEIGTTVNYMKEGVGPEGAKYTSGWKLLGVDDEGRLLIMSNDSINGAKVKLSGQEGFLIGIETLEGAVSGYKDGTIGIDVRSVTVEDIDAVTGYDKTTFTGEEYLESMVALYKQMGMTGTDAEIESQLLSSFGFTSKEQMSLMDNGLSVTYSWDGTEYPKYSYIKNGVTTGNLIDSHSSKGFTYYDKATNSFKTVAYTTTPGTIATIENDMYLYCGPLKYVEDSKAYKMLFMTADESSTSTYWLASRYVIADPEGVGFGVRFVADGLLYGSGLVNSGGYTYDYDDSFAVRAVVTLASGITLKDSTTVTGTYDIID